MVSQVVLSGTAEGGTDLSIWPVSSTQDALSSRGGELHLRSQDLIRFAAYASNHEFSVSSFMLADAYLVPLGAEEQAQLSAEMLNLFKTFGGDELGAAMQDEFDGLYVIGVNLIASQSGMRISVRRRGFVETSIVQEAERLLKAAWRELHLS